MKKTKKFPNSLYSEYGCVATVNRAAGIFGRYKDAVLFNRNLIISGACSLFVSAYVSQLYAESGSNDFANSTIALAVEYGVYIPVFAILFYINNRSKYVDPITGRRNSSKIWQDMKKLFAAFSVSEVIFSITRVSVQYQLLQAGNQPYESSMASSLVAWGVFFVSINSMARLVKLFRR